MSFQNAANVIALVFTKLQSQITAGFQDRGIVSRDAPVEIKTVFSAVKRHFRLIALRDALRVGRLDHL